MIVRLDHHLEKAAQAIQKIQQPAYKVEAALMGFEGIPQLHETVEEIQDSQEIFMGFLEGELKGFISYKKEDCTIDIHRLVVAPFYFRQGIGRRLLTYLLEQYKGHDFIVSTGTANEPAKKLYESHGFVEQDCFEVAPGVFCSRFLKRK
ncbi:GNAT family N-acetyltransferase [Planococcus shenhongbingii]|uniref:GNAT family N-acetyltransferase n=1 Tax=Planococcus shenhongbingii TaxID=3058398 RepID=UPI0026124B38|nr:GNAT family N-acetyltransferase [Planococcus sp. N016]WKA58040.1 GNAT family N-acetyltransferase [Planococcus sp. N016]